MSLQSIVFTPHLYSRYSVACPAPQGLESKTDVSQLEKWEHFTVGSNITILIRFDSNLFSMYVTQGPTVLERIMCRRTDTRRVLQFSVRSPSMSCKYLSIEQSSILIRRFQFTLLESDFIRLLTFLQSIDIQIKGNPGTAVTSTATPVESITSALLPVVLPSSKPISTNAITKNNPEVPITPNPNPLESQVPSMTSAIEESKCSNNTTEFAEINTKGHMVNMNDAKNQGASTAKQYNELTTMTTSKETEITDPQNTTKAQKRSVKISKRLIRQKMKDKSFIKWVCIFFYCFLVL